MSLDLGLSSALIPCACPLSLPGVLPSAKYVVDLINAYLICLILQEAIVFSNHRQKFNRCFLNMILRGKDLGTLLKAKSFEIPVFLFPSLRPWS